MGLNKERKGGAASNWDVSKTRARVGQPPVEHARHTEIKPRLAAGLTRARAPAPHSDSLGRGRLVANGESACLRHGGFGHRLAARCNPVLGRLEGLLRFLRAHDQHFNIAEDARVL